MAGHRTGVVGGGIVGVALARHLVHARPGASVTVLEKEDDLARHQTGRNSGVVHAGIYYAPGSLKAQLCRRGMGLLRDFCAEQRLPYVECGKLVVALDRTEEQRLRDLHSRAVANGVPGLALVGPDGLRAVEPHVTGVAALHSPHTAITDFVAVTRALAADAVAHGAVVRTGAEVTAIRPHGDAVTVLAGGEEWVFDELVLCAGLYSDRLARLAGDDDDPRVVPFRGEYFALRPERTALVRGLVYPVPDPRYPFLGVHLTRRVDGAVLVGPNAVLALAREGYRRRDVRWADLAETLRWPGFRRMAARHWRTGVREVVGSLSPRAFTRAARRYLPELRRADLLPAPSGVRAQALGRDGALVDDFRVTRRGPVVSVRNAPSPAATSSLAIAEHLAGLLAGPGQGAR